MLFDGICIPFLGKDDILTIKLYNHNLTPDHLELGQRHHLSAHYDTTGGRPAVLTGLLSARDSAKVMPFEGVLRRRLWQLPR
jgi:hypothetical protein